MISQKLLALLIIIVMVGRTVFIDADQIIDPLDHSKFKNLGNIRLIRLSKRRPEEFISNLHEKWRKFNSNEKENLIPSNRHECK